MANRLKLLVAGLKRQADVTTVLDAVMGPALSERGGAKYLETEGGHGTHAGIDVSFELSSVCVVDAQGKIVKEAKYLGGCIAKTFARFSPRR